MAWRQVSLFALRDTSHQMQVGNRTKLPWSICLFWVAACCWLPACSVPANSAGSAPKTWWVKDLTLFNRPRVTVTDEEERPLGRFSTRTLRAFSQAKIGITQASGLYTELVIVEGEDPDALAGFLGSTVWGIPAGTPVIVLSVGLIQLLGRDTDAAAYLIGHETAHLLKRHAETSETRHVALRRIRVLTETGASGHARPATDSTPFTVAGVVSRYSEPQEREAHAAGLRYAMAAGYEGSGAVRLAHMLAAASSGKSAPYLKRHGPDTSRP